MDQEQTQERVMRPVIKHGVMRGDFNTGSSELAEALDKGGQLIAFQVSGDTFAAVIRTTGFEEVPEEEAKQILANRAAADSSNPPTELKHVESAQEDKGQS